MHMNEGTLQAAAPARQAAPLPLRIVREWGGCLAFAVLLLLLWRLALMAMLPLADTTEARYGEIARQTVSNGFWLLPHMDPHTPFFAKPPLATWASALSMALFGINEFAARLPALLAALATAWVAALFATQLGLRARWLVVPVLATSPLFFISAGAVMTDALQAALVFGAQYCAWHALTAIDRPAGRNWRHGFWLLIGIGALSKGIATWALVGLPIAAFLLLRRQMMQGVRSLVDGGGIVMGLLMFVPWYVEAERVYPGFLRYFIVGEHFSRFLVPGWTGDRYGTAHRQPLGAIWLFWVGAMLPWIAVFWRLGTTALRRRVPLAPVAAYLWCCTLVPLLFFTFSSNIIWTYALTAVPPFAVLAAQWLEDCPPVTRRRVDIALAAYALAACAATPLISREAERHSDRALVRAFQADAPPGTVLTYLTKPAFSSAFYTRGALRTAAPGTPASQRPDAPVVMDNAALVRQGIDPTRIRFAGRRRSLVEEH